MNSILSCGSLSCYPVLFNMKIDGNSERALGIAFVLVCG